MNTSATIESPTRLSGMQLDEIKGCYTADRGRLETVLSEFNLSSIVDKLGALLDAMGIKENDEVFYSDVDDDENDRYEAMVGAFFSGFWRRENN